VHVFPDPAELGRVFVTDLAIATAPEQFLDGWSELEVVKTPKRADKTRLLRAAYIKGRERSAEGPVDLAQVVRHVSEVLPDDAIITNGAGNYTAWVHRYFQFKQLGTQLAPIAGAMGFGVPAAIAAKSVYPERTVVCFAGDGCFLMSGQELATAVHNKLAIIVIVVNNDSYGTIRSHQQRNYPGRLYGMDLSNPDFVAYAKSFGIGAELVMTTDDFISAFDRARKSATSTLLEVRVDASLRLSLEN
jgi:acetolactate synthase-1/2/3 large subunit